MVPFSNTDNSNKAAFTNTDNVSKEAFTTTDNVSRKATALPETVSHCNCCSNEFKPAKLKLTLKLKHKTTDVEAPVNGIFLASENKQLTKPGCMNQKTANNEANLNSNTATMTGPPMSAMLHSRPMTTSNFTTFVAPIKAANTSNKTTNTVQNPARFVRAMSHPVQKTANVVKTTTTSVQKTANILQTMAVPVQKTANFVQTTMVSVQQTPNFVKTTAAPVQKTVKTMTPPVQKTANIVKTTTPSVQKIANFVKATAAPVRKPAHPVQSSVQKPANFVKMMAAPVQKPANPVKETVQIAANPVKTTIQKKANPALDILLRQRILASELRMSKLYLGMWKEIKDREEGMAREIFHIRNSQMLPHQTRPPPPQHSVAWISHLVSSSRPNSGLTLASSRPNSSLTLASSRPSSSLTLTSNDSLGSSWDTC